MRSQKRLNFSTVLMAPAQTQPDGTLLVIAEASGTIPPITDKVEVWTINPFNWEKEIKKKWTGFDPSMFQNAKTFTTNRPYTNEYKKDKSWTTNINKSLNYNFTNNPRSFNDQGSNSPDMLHKYNPQEIKAIDKLFSDYDNQKLAPNSPPHTRGSAVSKYIAQKYKDNPGFDLAI